MLPQGGPPRARRAALEHLQVNCEMRKVMKAAMETGLRKLAVLQTTGCLARAQHLVHGGHAIREVTGAEAGGTWRVHSAHPPQHVSEQD